MTVICSLLQAFLRTAILCYAAAAALSPAVNGHVLPMELSTLSRVLGDTVACYNVDGEFDVRGPSSNITIDSAVESTLRKQMCKVDLDFSATFLEFRGAGASGDVLVASAVFPIGDGPNECKPGEANKVLRGTDTRPGTIWSARDACHRGEQVLAITRTTSESDIIFGEILDPFPASEQAGIRTVPSKCAATGSLPMKHCECGADCFNDLQCAAGATCNADGSCIEDGVRTSKCSKWIGENFKIEDVLDPTPPPTPGPTSVPTTPVPVISPLTSPGTRDPAAPESSNFPIAAVVVGVVGGLAGIIALVVAAIIIRRRNLAEFTQATGPPNDISTQREE